MEDLEERMDTQKKSSAGFEKQKTEMGKERDGLMEELEQMKQIKVLPAVFRTLIETLSLGLSSRQCL